MSLIEEALRRAQTIPAKHPEASTPEVSVPSSVPEPPPLMFSPLIGTRLLNAKWWVGLAVGGAAMVVLVLWGYSVMLRWQLTKITKATPEPQPAAVSAPAPVDIPRAASPQPVVAQAPANPKPRPKRAPELALNGIVEGRGEPLAIINGMILRVGESVAGATLLEIRGEEARLRWRDEELVLSTTR